MIAYLGDGGTKMTMGTNKLKLIRMCLDSIKKPLQLFISNAKFGVFITSGNVRMYLSKHYTQPSNNGMITINFLQIYKHKWKK